MTSTDRIASLFGEIAVAAGSWEASHSGYPPRYLMLPPADAAALRDYVIKSNDSVSFKPAHVWKRTRLAALKALVSGLEVKVVVGPSRLYVRN